MVFEAREAVVDSGPGLVGNWKRRRGVAEEGFEYSTPAACSHSLTITLRRGVPVDTSIYTLPQFDSQADTSERNLTPSTCMPDRDSTCNHHV